MRIARSVVSALWLWSLPCWFLPGFVTGLGSLGTHLVLQAEDIPDDDIFRCIKTNIHPYASSSGAAGDGINTYVEFGEKGSWIQWRVPKTDLPGTQKFQLHFRYSNGSRKRRDCHLHINGNRVGTIAFPQTTVINKDATENGWHSWTTTAVMIDADTLQDGDEAIIRLTSAFQKGLNLDYMAIGTTSLVEADAEETPSSWYEAEHQRLQGAEPLGFHTGASGDKDGTKTYVDFKGGPGSWIEWNEVKAPSSATGHRLLFRFSNGGSGTRKTDLYVNSVFLQTIAFPPTGSWTAWETLSVKAPLKENGEINTIRITVAEGSSGPNVDYLHVVDGVEEKVEDNPVSAPAPETVAEEMNQAPDSGENDPPCSSMLRSGEDMVPGEKICSENGKYELVLTEEGRLVLQKNGAEVGTKSDEGWDVGISGARRLAMQLDGNLVAYGDKKVLWTTGTHGLIPEETQALLFMKDDGTLELSKDDQVVWCRNTKGVDCEDGADQVPFPAPETPTDEGEADQVPVSDPETPADEGEADQDPVPAPETPADEDVQDPAPTPDAPVAFDPTPVDETTSDCSSILRPTEKMVPGEKRCSENGNYEFVLTKDGRLVLQNVVQTNYGEVSSKSFDESWDAGIKKVSRLSMQRDGNLVAYAENQAIWSTGTYAVNPEQTHDVILVVKDDGNLELSKDDEVIWCRSAKGTECSRPTIPALSGNPSGELKIVVFSVLSADCSLIIFPTGKLMMVDSATKEAFSQRVLPMLQKHGVRHLDYYVETHSDFDHVGGREALLANGIIDSSTQLWDWRTFRYGDSFDLEGTKWFISNALDRARYGNDPNPNSLSYRIEYNGFVYSASGDEYDTAQDRYLADYPELVPAHVRNTAHHMWGPASPDYLVATNPFLFIISCSIKVREGYAFYDEFLWAVDKIQKKGGRLRDYFITEEVGHVFVRASNKDKWSYETCRNTKTCMLDL